jgi:acylphosphatase
MNERLHAFVRGDVQGVSFRWFIDREALRSGLRGWARNRRDGRVEVLVEGERAVLEAFLEQIRRGPRMARVEGVDVRWDDATGEFPDFQIIPTV